MSKKRRYTIKVYVVEEGCDINKWPLLFTTDLRLTEAVDAFSLILNDKLGIDIKNTLQKHKLDTSTLFTQIKSSSDHQTRSAILGTIYDDSKEHQVQKALGSQEESFIVITVIPVLR